MAWDSSLSCKVVLYGLRWSKQWRVLKSTNVSSSFDNLVLKTAPQIWDIWVLKARVPVNAILWHWLNLQCWNWRTQAHSLYLSAQGRRSSAKTIWPDHVCPCIGHHTDWHGCRVLSGVGVPEDLEVNRNVLFMPKRSNKCHLNGVKRVHLHQLFFKHRGLTCKVHMADQRDMKGKRTSAAWEFSSFRSLFLHNYGCAFGTLENKNGFRG